MKQKILVVFLVCSNVFLLISLICVCLFKYTKNKANDIFKKNINSVVEVKAETIGVGESYGSGVIYDKDGYLITNAHVVSYTHLGETLTFDNLFIRFASKEDYQSATLIKIDSELDLAILKIDDSSIKYTPITLSTLKYSYGDEVYAIGNTSNYGIGISEGIISVPEVNIKYNEINRLVIQTDIDISSGNSGGAIIAGAVAGAAAGVVTSEVVSYQETGKIKAEAVLTGIGVGGAVGAVTGYVAGTAISAVISSPTGLGVIDSSNYYSTLTKGNLNYYTSLATNNPNAMNTYIGKYVANSSSSYEKVASKANACFFNLDNYDELVQIYGLNQVESINKQFIINRLSQCNTIFCTINPKDATGALANEIKWIEEFYNGNCSWKYVYVNGEYLWKVLTK